jgi:hypothetical protein
VKVEKCLMIDRTKKLVTQTTQEDQCHQKECQEKTWKMNETVKEMKSTNRLQTA